jgi:hypothetical protein
LLLPIKCPRIQTGCHAIMSGVDEHIDKCYDKCENPEEYIYCEHYSSGALIQESNIHIMQILQSTRKR